MNPFVGYDNIIPLLAPQDLGTTGGTTGYMDLKTAQRAAFLVSCGAITSTTVTDSYVITMEAASVESGTEVAVGFRYRMSGAVGTNTWGAVTSCASTGLSLSSASDDNILVWIEVEPGELMNENNDYRYVRLVLTDTPDMEAGLFGVVGLIDARYKQTTFVSATASASA